MSACPRCGTLKTRVLETRVDGRGWTVRRRACAYQCGTRWNTTELPSDCIEVEAEVLEVSDDASAD